jgi:hypothetical protein
MLYTTNRSLNATPDPRHGAACITHVVLLLIAALAFRQVVLEAEEFMQAERRVRVDGVGRCRFCCICVDGLVRTAADCQDLLRLLARRYN